MANYKPKDLAVFLRRCCNGICDDSCPYQSLFTAKCIQQMGQYAAAMIERHKTVLEQLDAQRAQMIAKLRADTSIL